MVWGILLLLAGLLLLADNFGLLPVSAWALLFPLALIVLGVGAVWGATRKPRGADTLSLPSAGVTNARIRFSFGGGRFLLSDGSAPGSLLSGTFGGGVEHAEHSSGGTLDADLKLPIDPTRWSIPVSGSPFEWNVRLAAGVPLALRVEGGASETKMDLTRLLVTALDIRTGASSTEVRLPAAAGYTRGEVHAGAASVVLSVPEGVAARVSGTAGLGAIEVSTGRFPKVGNAWESPGYASAANRIEIVADVGVGEVRVQ